MKVSVKKLIADIGAMLLLVVAIVTGFMLHREVWHLFVYNNRPLWYAHEALGLGFCAFVGVHCVQHSFWFKNFAKIQPNRKRVTLILLALGVIVLLTGVALMLGSHSGVVSRIHYVGAIALTVIAVGHVAKRWTIFKRLF